ncbi:hypothetical protein HYV86_02590 [Candidatus Woesearchaeota archaeon]|nr:hypothetical protein [Candidatus Woesearchaeota archaeon]
MPQYQSEHFLYERAGSGIGYPTITPQQGYQAIIGLVHIYRDSDVLHRIGTHGGIFADPWADSTIAELSDVYLDGLCSRIVSTWEVARQKPDQVRAELKELQSFEKRLAKEFRDYRIPVDQ